MCLLFFMFTDQKYSQHGKIENHKIIYRNCSVCIKYLNYSKTIYSDLHCIRHNYLFLS